MSENPGYPMAEDEGWAEAEIANVRDGLTEAEARDVVTVPEGVEPEEALRKHVEEIQVEAKRSFKLRDRLRGGVKQIRKTVPIFFDLQAVADYQAKKAESDAIFKQAERPGVKEDTRAALLEQHDNALDELSAIRERMLADSIVIHLATIPNEVLKATRAKTRLDFKAANRGVPLTDEQAEELASTVALRTLAMGIERVVDSDGSVSEQVEEEDVRELERSLHPTQWDRLYSTFEAMLFTQQVGEDATNDPGF